MESTILGKIGWIVMRICLVSQQDQGPACSQLFFLDQKTMKAKEEVNNSFETIRLTVSFQ